MLFYPQAFIYCMQPLLRHLDNHDTYLIIRN